MDTLYEKVVFVAMLAVLTWVSACARENIAYYHLGGDGDGDATVGDPDAAPHDPGDTDTHTGGARDSESAVEPPGLTLYYIRHAETVANSHGVSGPDDVGHDELTPLGLEQKEALSRYLLQNHIVPDAVIVSPTWRTQQTIEPFLLAENTTAEIWVELTEIYSTQPTGASLPTEPVMSEEKASIEAENIRFRDDTPAYYWQVDTYEEELFMLMTARDKIMRAFSRTGKTIVVVGHLLAGNMLIGLLEGHNMLTNIPARIQMKNTGIQKLVQDVTTGEMRLVEANLNRPASQ